MVTRTYGLLSVKGGSDGKPTIIETPLADGATVPLGSRVRVHLKVTHDRPYPYVMIEDRIPPGFEPSLPEAERNRRGWTVGHEFHDDRACFFATRLEAGTQEITYELFAEAAGVYRVRHGRGRPDVYAGGARMHGAFSAAGQGGGLMSRRAAWVMALAGMVLLGAVVAGLARLGREVVLASFTTGVAGRSEAQRNNIALGVARLDGVIVPSRAVFSFNEAVGARVLEAGYERAPALTFRGVRDTPGGGICQLSSTLYNAALLAGLDIIERWPHLRPVASVGPGRDATVEHGRFDLRVRNPHPFAVRLAGRLEGERLVVEIRGGTPLPRPISVRVECSSEMGRLVRVCTWRRVGEREERMSSDLYPL